MPDIITSLGRIGDRSRRTGDGAMLATQALERRHGGRSVVISNHAPPADDDWRTSLPQARETLQRISTALSDCMGTCDFPVVVASTCSASLATLPVVASRHPDCAVLWIDAHGDFNTPATTDSGYLGGMVLSAACGLWDSGHGAGLRPERIVIAGARDIDPGERELLEGSGVLTVPPANATPKAILSALQGASFWIHVDWDVLEPGSIPSDYSVSGGMTPAQLTSIFDALPSAGLIGLEIAEFSPSADEAETGRALRTMLDVLAPLFDGRPRPRSFP